MIVFIALIAVWRRLGGVIFLIVFNRFDRFDRSDGRLAPPVRGDLFFLFFLRFLRLHLPARLLLSRGLRGVFSTFFLFL